MSKLICKKHNRVLIGKNGCIDCKNMKLYHGSDNNRYEDFKRIQKLLKPKLKFASSKTLLAEGDSLNLLKLLPNQSVSLILTDPPYHTTKKDNIVGDTAFKEDKHYIEWMSEYSKEWLRILKPNGSLYCFCAPEMSARLEVEFAKRFNILSQIVWTKPNEPGFDGWKQKMKKESLRQWYAHTERIIFAEPSHEGNLFKSYFGNVIRELRKESGLSMHQLTAIVGAHGEVNHGGAVSNWEAGRNVPSREQYNKIAEGVLSTGIVKFVPAYEDVIRPFKMDGTKEFTDVWNFPNVRPYKFKHPAEKPIELLKHIIEASTYKNDVVLDCFSGSGNTAFAALKLGRYSISMEIDPTWISRSARRLEIISTRDNLVEKNNPEIIVNETSSDYDMSHFPLFTSSK